MTDDLREQLRDADPVGREPEWSEDHVREMRDIVLSRARHSSSAASPRLTLWFAAAIGSAAVIVAFLNTPVEPRESVGPESAQAPSQHEPLQVQFQTPRGTRIVWVLDPKFPL